MTRRTRDKDRVRVKGVRDQILVVVDKEHNSCARLRLVGDFLVVELLFRALSGDVGV